MSMALPSPILPCYIGRDHATGKESVSGLTNWKAGYNEGQSNHG